MRQQWFTVRQIARLLGMGKTSVNKMLRAANVPTRLRTGVEYKNAPRVVHRADLVRWLVDANFPADRLRSLLNPDGAVVLVRTPPELEVALGATRTHPTDSLFGLGVALGEVPSWAVVIDLPACGTSETCVSLAELSERADRPLLVGLYGDDGAGSAAARVFDCLLPRSARPDDLARSILGLRRNAAR